MKNYTELVFILDRSGSMAGLESDTIGGYNSMLKKQKEAEGEAVVTTVLFDNKIDVLHDRIPVNSIASLTDHDYKVGGTTALLDAIGFAIEKMKKVQEATKEEYRAKQVLFVITTDGFENASKRYTYPEIKTLVEQQKELGWEFIFLGANIDAIATAAQIGIGEENAVEYHADQEGMQVNYETISETVLHYRKEGVIQQDWKKKIEQDYQRRK